MTLGMESTMFDSNASALVEFDIPVAPTYPSVHHIPHRVYINPTANTNPVAHRVIHPRQSKSQKESSPSLLSPMANLSITFAGVIMLIVQLIQTVDPVGIDLVEVLDTIICLTLLADFIYDFIYSNDKKTLLKNRWWEPLASIPIIDTTHKAILAVRLLRILRLLRIFRLHREFRQFFSTGYDYLLKNRILDLSSFVGLTILTGSMGFFYAEQGVNPALHTYKDSVWWAMVTITTIGYGDIYPITTAGRLVAIAMMLVGIGCLSLLTALIASNLLRENKCKNCGSEI